MTQNCGGRAAFGYDKRNTAAEMGAADEILMSYMTGSRGDGKRRTTGYAFGDGSEYASTGMALHNPSNNGKGHLWTTLNPAPNAVFPESVVVNRKGAGNIVMDTYLEIVQPDQAVIRVSGPTVLSGRWSRTFLDKFMYCFEFDKHVSPVTVRAVSDKCCGRHTERKMSGDRVEYGSHKEWSF